MDYRTKGTFSVFCKNAANNGADAFSKTLKSLITFHHQIYGVFIYSRTSLVRTPGDRQNVYSLSGIRINRCYMY